MTDILEAAAQAVASDDARPGAEAAPVQDTQASAPAGDDFDAADLAAAMAELAAEGTMPAASPQAPTAPQAPPAAGIPPVEEAAPGPVPYARFAEVNQKAAAAREEIAYLKGKLEAVQATPASSPAPAGAPAPAAGPGLPQEIAAAVAQANEAAIRFDNGEITMAEFNAVQTQTQIALTNYSMTQAQALVSGQRGVADQAILDAHAESIEAKYPVLTVMTTEQITALADMARSAAQVAGKQYAAGFAGLKDLREDIGKLAEFYGPKWGIAAPASSNPSRPNAPGQPSPAAQARANKLNLAASFPPDTATMGGSGQMDEFSEARINSMTDEEIEALPRSVRDRLKSG